MASSQRSRKGNKPIPVPWTALRRWIVSTGALAGAITAILALWVYLGFPRLATSADIQRLNASQAEMAVDLYQREVRDALITRSTVKADPATQALVDQNLNAARDKLKAAQDRKLELAR